MINFNSIDSASELNISEEVGLSSMVDDKHDLDLRRKLEMKRDEILLLKDIQEFDFDIDE